MQAEAGTCRETLLPGCCASIFLLMKTGQAATEQ
jgi:hypothetical protein